MLAVTLAVLALPGLVTAETSYIGNPFDGGCKSGWPKDSWSADEQNRQTIANNGAYTVVYRDAQAVEAGVTCPKLTLNTPGGTYIYTYTDAKGVEQTVSGDLSWKDGVFTLDGMKRGHFGADCLFFVDKCTTKLQATYGGANGLQLMTVRDILLCFRNSYYLVPSSTVASNCNGCSA